MGERLGPDGKLALSLFQEHSDALPVGESNQESATFRLLIRRSDN